MVATKLQLRSSICCIFFFFVVVVSTIGQQDLLHSCSEISPSSVSFPGRSCDGNNNKSCKTFAVLRTTSYYSSLSNLSLYLGTNRFAIAEANGFSNGTDFLPLDQPLLIPIDCKCNNGGFFGAELTKTTLKGESFNGIVQSLEGLTTCKSIQEKNPIGVTEHLMIPIECGCPSFEEINHQFQFLISYPVRKGDTITSLASIFNITIESILAANVKARSELENLVPFSTLLIPVHDKPRFGQQPSIRRKKKAKMRKMTGVYTAVAAVVAFVATIAIVATLLLIQWNCKKRPSQDQHHHHHGSSIKGGDLEFQQLSLSVRTTSEKKVSFEGSNDDSISGGQIIMDPITPRKTLIETYTIEELKKATEEFSTSNLIQDSVYHGRLNGKDLAIKKTSSETISKIKFGLFHDSINHHHPYLIRLYGTCITEGCCDSYLVFEYAKNGSLKDWLQGGLAMKSQFISSCYCFLNWNQRLRICLDVAAALQFIHHIMNPPYVHKNIKSRNIFLGEEFNAKVGNFGLAKCVEDKAEESDYRCKGYLAPEYLKGSEISTSIDIFAYGVVLLEILSGQAPITEDGVKLSEKIRMILQSENSEELREWIDKALGENYSFDNAVTLANLARSCVEDDPSLRPSAGEIVEKLSSLVEELPEGDQFSISENSCKPLVKSDGNPM